MATEETDMETTERERRGGRPSSGPVTTGSPGTLRLLWADLRKQQIYSEPDPLADEEFELQQEDRARRSAQIGRVHSLGPEAYERMRRRYWGAS